MPGIYEMLALCDEFAIAQLHAVLTAGVRAVFTGVYADYSKYYKYNGAV
jgi:hypothetical protein